MQLGIAERQVRTTAMAVEEARGQGRSACITSGKLQPQDSGSQRQKAIEVLSQDVYLQWFVLLADNKIQNWARALRADLVCPPWVPRHRRRARFRNVGIRYRAWEGRPQISLERDRFFVLANHRLSGTIGLLITCQNCLPSCGGTRRPDRRYQKLRVPGTAPSDSVQYEHE